MTLGVMQNLLAILEHRDLVFRIDGADQQRIVNILRAEVLQGLVRVVRLDVVPSHHKAVLWRDPQFELLPVADHVEGRGAHDGQQPDHMQHGGLARQHIAANLLVVGDMPLLYATGGGINVHRSLQRLNLRRLLVDAVNQICLGRFVKNSLGVGLLHRPRPKQTARCGQHCENQG